MLQSILFKAVLAVVVASQADQPPTPRAVPANPAPTRPGAPKGAPGKPATGNQLPGNPAPGQPAAAKPSPVKPGAQLAIGDAVPKLEFQDFVKGEPVKQLAHGRIYVLEFFAAGSDPCRESFPFLSKLQADKKDVTIIGVSVDADAKEVKSLVDAMGDQMKFRVAIDARDGQNGRMTQSWMEASGQEGVPACFVINGDGRVAWIGHPADLEKPLDDIIAGKWDLAKQAAEFKKAAAEKREIAKLQDDLGGYLRKRDYAGAISLLDNATKTLDLPPEPLLIELALLAGPANDPARALALGQKLHDRALKEEDGGMLMQLCHSLVDANIIFPAGNGKAPAPPPKLDAKLAALAVAAAERGEQMTHSGNDLEDADSLVLLAKAYRAAGQTEKAIARLDDAADLVNGTIDTASKALSEIRALRSTLGGKSPPATPSKKPLKAGP